jgi:hypothetical protein
MKRPMCSFYLRACRDRNGAPFQHESERSESPRLRRDGQDVFGAHSSPEKRNFFSSLRIMPNRTSYSSGILPEKNVFRTLFVEERDVHTETASWVFSVSPEMFPR